MTIGLGTDLLVKQNIIRNNFIDTLFFCYASKTPARGHLGGAEHELPLVVT